MDRIEKDKTYLFESMPIGQAIAKLSIPTVLSMLVAIFYSMADTYFVSLLNDPLETAAVTLGATIILSFNAIVNLFGIGGSSVFSRALGNKDYKTAQESSVFSLWGAIIAGLILSALCAIFNTQLLNILGADEFNFDVTRRYVLWTVIFGAMPAILNTVTGQIVKGEGMALHASIGMMSGCILNVILDPFFILPQFLNMGAEGAGLATFISNSFACLYYLVLILIVKKGKTLISLDIKKFTLRKELVYPIMIVGVPAAIQNLLNVIGATILNNFASVYSSTAVSAVGIAHKLSNLSLYVAMGISSGVTPLISYNFASKNYKRMKDVIIRVIKIVVPIMLVTATGMVIFSKEIIMMFMENEEVVQYGGAFLKGMALAQPFLAIDFTAVGVYQAIGYGKYSLFFAVARKILLEIPALFVLNKLFPLYGLGYAQLVSEVVLAIAATIIIRKIFNDLNKEELSN